MDEMDITSVQYTENNLQIIATVDGQNMIVPTEVGNRHYDEIMRQVDAGTLTIQEADSE